MIAARNVFAAVHAKRRYPLTSKARSSSGRARRPGASRAGRSGRNRRTSAPAIAIARLPIRGSLVGINHWLGKSNVDDQHDCIAHNCIGPRLHGSRLHGYSPTPDPMSGR
jgi:hypothetical protein